MADHFDGRAGLATRRRKRVAVERASNHSASSFAMRSMARGSVMLSRNSACTRSTSICRASRASSAARRSLQYLAKACGITLISINGWTNKSEPSAAELARLARQIEVERVHALFLDSITDPRAMERIAKETGAVIAGTLYGDALSAPGGEAGTYIEMIRHDVATLKAGMLKN